MFLIPPLGISLQNDGGQLTITRCSTCKTVRVFESKNGYATSDSGCKCVPRSIDTSPQNLPEIGDVIDHTPADDQFTPEALTVKERGSVFHLYRAVDGAGSWVYLFLDPSTGASLVFDDQSRNDIEPWQL